MAIARGLSGTGPQSVYMGLLAALHPQVIVYSRQARAYSCQECSQPPCAWPWLLAYCRTGRHYSQGALARLRLLLGRHPAYVRRIRGCRRRGSFLLAQRHFNIQSNRLRSSYPVVPAFLLSAGWLTLLMMERIRNNLNSFWIARARYPRTIGRCCGAALPLLPTFYAVVFVVVGLVLLVRGSFRAPWPDGNMDTGLHRSIGIRRPVACIVDRPFALLQATRYFLPAVVLIVLPAGCLFSRLPSLLGGPSVLGLVSALPLSLGGLSHLYGETALDGTNAPKGRPPNALRTKFGRRANSSPAEPGPIGRSDITHRPRLTNQVSRTARFAAGCRPTRSRLRLQPHLGDLSAR